MAAESRDKKSSVFSEISVKSKIQPKEPPELGKVFLPHGLMMAPKSRPKNNPISWVKTTSTLLTVSEKSPKISFNQSVWNLDSLNCLSFKYGIWVPKESLFSIKLFPKTLLFCAPVWSSTDAKIQRLKGISISWITINSKLDFWTDKLLFC